MGCGESLHGIVAVNVLCRDLLHHSEVTGLADPRCLMSSSLDSVIDQVDNNNLNLVRFLFCDTSNVVRGKTSSAKTLRARLQTGIGLVKGTIAMNMLDQPQSDTGYGATGEVRLVPDLKTFRVLPYVPAAGMVLCDMQELNREPWQLCPRSILKRVLARCQDEGVRFKSAFEPEFSLGRLDGDRFVPIDSSNCFSTEGMNRAADFMHDFMNALSVQGITIEQYYPELGPGQHELSIRHVFGLEAADNQIIYRETLRGVATRMGLVASMAPKPSLQWPGNGCHLHISAWDGTTNLMGNEQGLSEFGRHFVAGLVKHLRGLVAVTCASVNSYRRLQPRSWSSAYTCWGYENREAAVRVPSVYWGHESDSANIEIKCVDASSNPYLALAAVIAAGMDGVRNKLEPPEPVSVDPSTIGEVEAERGGIYRLPASLAEALEELARDEVLCETLGPEYLKVYLAVKKSEYDQCSKMSADEESRAHLTRY